MAEAPEQEAPTERPEHQQLESVKLAA